jgi:hypothetical protein
MIAKAKKISKLARKHWRAFVHDVHWYFNHVTFYAMRITRQLKKYPYNSEEVRYWAKLPEDPSKYPFDKQKASSALYEVTQWIREDETQGK